MEPDGRLAFAEGIVMSFAEAQFVARDLRAARTALCTTGCRRFDDVCHGPGILGAGCMAAKKKGSGELAFLRERAAAEPRLHSCGELPVAGEPEMTLLRGVAHGLEAHPDRCHRLQIGA